MWTDFFTQQIFNKVSPYLRWNHATLLGRWLEISRSVSKILTRIKCRSVNTSGFIFDRVEYARRSSCWVHRDRVSRVIKTPHNNLISNNLALLAMGSTDGDLTTSQLVWFVRLIFSKFLVSVDNVLIILITNRWIQLPIVMINNGKVHMCMHDAQLSPNDSLARVLV